jgi:lipopolysaccharide transport system ATP-binding protein
MSDSALRMEGVYKQFKKGEVYNSLRDVLPALSGHMFRRNPLSKSDRRDFWALQDISFEVKRGEAFGIIGPNGAGKSTILKILSRIMTPTKGKMVVSGRLSALIEVAAGFHQDLTGRENIYLNGTILGMSKREIDSKIDQIIAFSGIEEFIDTPVKRYSSGMYARLGFSVASHVDPDILIVDEVLSVGDLIFQQSCFNHMRTIMNKGTTVIFVSHNLKVTTELCKRAMLLSHGKVVEINSTDIVVRRYLSDAQNADDDHVSKSVYISKVVVRDRTGERSMYETGQKAWVDITIEANERIDKVAVVVYLLDQNLYKLFATSTERLGHSPISLDAGESACVTFELTLNIAYGTFYLCAAIHRYDLCKEYDSRQPAATIFIGSSLAVCGAVNCFPKLVECSQDESHVTCEMV